MIHIVFEEANIEALKKAIELANWKQTVTREWDSITIISEELPQSALEHALQLGDTFIAKIEINLGHLKSKDIRVEILFGEKINDEIKRIIYKTEMDSQDHTEGNVLYSCSIPVEKAGVYDYVFRISPKSKELAYAEDFPLIKWI